MSYALIPDGYTLTKVTKDEKQAVKELYKHQNTTAILDNQNTPLLLGVGGLALFTPILWKLFLDKIKEAGVTVTPEQNAALSILFPVSQLLPGVGYDLGDATDLFNSLLGGVLPVFKRKTDTPTGPPPWDFRGGR